MTRVLGFRRANSSRRLVTRPCAQPLCVMEHREQRRNTLTVSDIHHRLLTAETTSYPRTHNVWYRRDLEIWRGTSCTAGEIAIRAPERKRSLTLERDQVEKISKLYEAHIELTSDVRNTMSFGSMQQSDLPQLQDLYNARIALERDYASKMQALTRKASERKARMDLPLILGSDPNPGWDEDTLKKRQVQSFRSQGLN